MGYSELTNLIVEGLAELYLLEEVKSCLLGKVRSYIDEKGLRTLSEVGLAADHYFLHINDPIHKNSLTVPKPKPPSNSQSRLPLNKTVMESRGPPYKLVPVGECAGGEGSGVTT